MKSIISLILILLGLFLTNGNPIAIPEDKIIHRQGPEKQVLRLIEQCRVRSPYQYQNLTVFPIVAKTESQSDYLTLEQGINNGYVEIRELGSGEVNKVKVKNKSHYHIFGLAGELILGAKQDRMLKEDVLLPPFQKWIEIPVYCTEHGRWTEQTKTFQSKGLIVPGMLRAKARKTESQAEVWGSVDEVHAELGVAAKTKALKEVYEAPGVKDRAQPYLKEFLPMPKKMKNTIGVIIVVGNQILCADIFANHSLFEKMWEKLLRSYVIDALSKLVFGTVTLGEVTNFLNSVTDANFTKRVTPGVGVLFRINSDFSSGSALVFQNDVIHLDLFPNTDNIRKLDEPRPSFQSQEGRGEPAPRLDIRRERLHR